LDSPVFRVDEGFSIKRKNLLHIQIESSDLYKFRQSQYDTMSDDVASLCQSPMIRDSSINRLDDEDFNDFASLSCGPQKMKKIEGRSIDDFSIGWDVTLSDSV